MKLLKIAPILLTIISLSCEERVLNPIELYQIKKGNHHSTRKVELLQTDKLRFFATFNNTAIYSSKIAENQWDTNKLFGFSDCNSHHHENSARFGWRWIEDRIEVLTYTYVDGQREIFKIGETSIDTKKFYSIEVTEDQYIFEFDNETISVERSNSCRRGIYYLLFPYFGGDETAPHDISIVIERVML